MIEKIGGSEVVKSDDEIINILKAKDDPTLFNTLYKRYFGLVTSVISKIVQNPSDVPDLTQDVFSKIIPNIRDNKYNEQGQFKSWISRCAKNRAFDYNRTKRKTDYVPMEISENEINKQHSSATNNPEGILLSKEKIESLERFINKLSEEEQKILRMRLEGYNYKEISDETNTNEVTARGRYTRAIGKIQAMLKKEVS